MLRPAVGTKIGRDKGLGPQILLYVDIIIKLTYEVIGLEWEHSVLINITRLWQLDKLGTCAMV